VFGQQVRNLPKRVGLGEELRRVSVIDVIQTSALIRTRRSGRLTAGRKAFLP